jgi:hemolysin D
MAKNSSLDEMEFLPAALEITDTPPRPAARALVFLLISMLTAALTWSMVGHIDTVAVAQGQVVPRGRVQLIQPLENAIIRAIRVSDGQRVTKGDVLVELDPTEAEANTEGIKSDLLKSNLDLAIATALLTDDPPAAFAAPTAAGGAMLEAAKAQVIAEWEQLKSSLAALDAEIMEQREQLLTHELDMMRSDQLAPIFADRLKGLEQLHEQNLVRKPDLYASRQQVVENAAAGEAAEMGQNQAEARIKIRDSKKDEVKSGFIARAQERRAESLRKIAALEQQLVKEERRQSDRRLTSPVDGIVTGVSVFTVGGVVGTKDVLMRIVPEDARLEVEAMILNKDIGFVSVGQSTEVKLETFPFTRYGLIDGTVEEIWRDAIADEKQGLVYKAVVSLKDNKILVGSRWVNLAPGMAVQAEIKTGNRRIIDYFVSPFLKYRDEALRER